MRSRVDRYLAKRDPASGPAGYCMVRHEAHSSPLLAKQVIELSRARVAARQNAHSGRRGEICCLARYSCLRLIHAVPFGGFRTESASPTDARFGVAPILLNEAVVASVMRHSMIVSTVSPEEAGPAGGLLAV